MSVLRLLPPFALALAAPAAAQEPFAFQGAARYHHIPGAYAERPIPDDMRLLDLDGDGDLDLARVLDNRLQVALAEDGGWQAHLELDSSATGLLATDLESFDRDGDGDADVLLTGLQAGDPAAAWLISDGAGGLTPGAPFPVLAPEAVWPEVAAEDVDGDGALDLVLWSGGFDRIQVRPAVGTPQDVDAGGPVGEVVLGDVTGNGAPDLVLIRWEPGPAESVGVMANDGSGGFGAPTFPVTIENAFGLGLVDHDVDGDLDVVTTGLVFHGITYSWTSFLHTLENDGAGNLTELPKTVLFDERWLAHDVDAVELDGDGLPDLVLALFGPSAGGVSGTLVTLKGSGTGSWSDVARIPVHSKAVEVASLSPAGTPQILCANGTIVDLDVEGAMGGAPAAGPTPFPMGLDTLLDFDGDGVLDVARAGFFQAEVHRADGEGGFSLAASADLTGFGAGFAPISIAAGDVDGDGFEDLIHVSAFELAVTRNLGGTGLGTPTVMPTAPCEPETLGVALGDLDADGRTDLVRAAKHNADGLIAFGQPDGSLLVGCTTFPEYVGGMALDDLNGDGYDDLVYVSRADGGLTVMLNDLPAGGSLFAAPLHFTYPTKLSTLLDRRIATGDVDGDGDPDVVAPTTGASLAVLVNDGAGAMSLAQTVPTIGLPMKDVHLVDLNGDGARDLVARHEDSQSAFFVHENVGGTFALEGVAHEAGSIPSYEGVRLHVGDVDGDRAPDVVVGGATTDVSIPGPVVYLNRSMLRGDGLPLTGGEILLGVDVPVAAGQPYAILLGRFGTWPGLPLGSDLLPLNDDPGLFQASLSGVAVLPGFVGTLDADGRADAAIQLPPSLLLPPAFAIDAAVITLDAATGAPVASSSWGVTIP